MFLSLFLQVQHIFVVKCISRTSILHKEMFVFRFFLRNGLDQQLLDTLISADVLTDPADVFFIIEYVSIKHDCKDCVSISMDLSLHIKLDDAPLAYRSLDAVLITSNMKRIRSPVAWYTSVWLEIPFDRNIF